LRRTMSINLSIERPGVAAEVADGFWIIATQHHPGGSRSFPEINNRCLVFRIVEDSGPGLLVINGVDASAIPEVRRIEQETGLVVRYVLSPGGGHHVLLPAWVDAFQRLGHRDGVEWPMADPARILEEALTLSEQERARLARELIHSLEPDEPRAAAEWTQEIRTRIDQVQEGSVELDSWDAVEARLEAAARR
jgi:hypothetical protein